MVSFMGLLLDEKDLETTLPTPDRPRWKSLVDNKLYGIAANRVFYLTDSGWQLSAYRCPSELLELPLMTVD